MKFSDIKDLTIEELEKRLLTAREDQFESRMKHALGELSNTNHLRETRRNVGRIKTALNNNNKRKLSSR